MSPGLGKGLFRLFLVEIFLTEETVIFIMLESCYVTGPKFFQRSIQEQETHGTGVRAIPQKITWEGWNTNLFFIGGI